MRVILLSGIPGSGKSSTAKFFAEEGGKVRIVSADDYFMKSGEYRFDPHGLGDAHGECLRGFLGALQGEEYDMVIVDNTNTTTLELAPYVAMSNAFGVIPELYTLDVDPETAHKRNTHGVPLVAVQRMASAIKSREIPFYWLIIQNKIPQKNLVLQPERNKGQGPKGLRPFRLSCLACRLLYAPAVPGYAGRRV
jgi:predicted kinase